MKIGQMRITGLIAGLLVLILGALMMAEAVINIGSIGLFHFMFAENINRQFEFVIGLITVVLAVAVIDLSGVNS